jgi:hypothetical protein
MAVHPHIREVDGRRQRGSNRNYGAMALPKLRLSKLDLEHGIEYGRRRRAQGVDAWHRCVNAGGDPRVDLIVATEALAPYALGMK